MFYGREHSDLRPTNCEYAFVGPIGLIVAAIIGGAQGVVSALLGMILPTIIGLALLFAFGGLAFISTLLA